MSSQNKYVECEWVNGCPVPTKSNRQVVCIMGPNTGKIYNLEWIIPSPIGEFCKVTEYEKLINANYFDYVLAE